MFRPLPPLNALRAFESAGRHLSFSRAAEELHVTAAAVSHQIKGLEEHLGVRLFRRLPRGVLLTAAGHALLDPLGRAFDQLAGAVAQVEAMERRSAVNTSVMPTFAANWLVPRLDRFQRLYPDIDVRLSASTHPLDFDREDVDLGIRSSTRGYPGTLAVFRLTDDVFPVCSPRLLDGDKPLREPGDLGRFTLLHYDDTQLLTAFPSWAKWLDGAGVQGIDASRGPRFNPWGMAVEAAVDGLGVALVRSALVASDLAAGRLVKPFAFSVGVDFDYHVFGPEGVLDRPKVRAFFDWLMEEVRADLTTEIVRTPPSANGAA